MSALLRVRFTGMFSRQLGSSLSLMPRDRCSDHSPEHNCRPFELHIRLLPVRSSSLAPAMSMASPSALFSFVQPLLPSPLNFLSDLLVWCATTAPMPPAYTLMPRTRFFRGLSVLLCFSLFSLSEALVAQTWPALSDGLPNQDIPLSVCGSRPEPDSDSHLVTPMHCHPSSLIDVLAFVIVFAFTSAMPPNRILPFEPWLSSSSLSIVTVAAAGLGTTCRGRAPLVGTRHPSEDRGNHSRYHCAPSAAMDGAKRWKCGSASSAR